MALITALAKWTWTPASGSPLTLNDLTAWPRYQLIWPVKGLRALPDMPDNREVNTQAIGETVYDAYAGGKTITLSGRCYGRTFAERVAGDDALVSSFGPDITTGALGSGRMVVTPDPSLSTQLLTFTAVCRDAEPLEAIPLSPTQQPSPFFSEFTIDLRLADPRWFLWDGTTATSPRW